MSSATDSVLLQRFKSGRDPAAAQELWNRYFSRLAELARRRLADRTRRVADEEDVALSAFDSFFRGIDAGRFARLEDGDDLWQILVMLTERKAIDRIRRATAEKRGGGAVRGDSVFAPIGDSSLTLGFDRASDSEPDPEFAAMFADECEQFLKRLDDDELRRIALLKLEGCSNEEIAARSGRVLRSVQRKVETIRKIWERASISD